MSSFLTPDFSSLLSSDFSSFLSIDLSSFLPPEFLFFLSPDFSSLLSPDFSSPLSSDFSSFLSIDFLFFLSPDFSSFLSSDFSSFWSIDFLFFLWPDFSSFLSTDFSLLSSDFSSVLSINFLFFLSPDFSSFSSPDISSVFSDFISPFVLSSVSSTVSTVPDNSCNSCKSSKWAASFSASVCSESDLSDVSTLVSLLSDFWREFFFFSMIFSDFSSLIEVLTSVSLFSFDCSSSLEISSMSISLDCMYISILFSSKLSVPLSSFSVLSFTSVLLSSFSESSIIRSFSDVLINELLPPVSFTPLTWYGWLGVLAGSWTMLVPTMLDNCPKNRSTPLFMHVIAVFLPSIAILDNALPEPCTFILTDFKRLIISLAELISWSVIKGTFLTVTLFQIKGSLACWLAGMPLTIDIWCGLGCIPVYTRFLAVPFCGSTYIILDLPVFVWRANCCNFRDWVLWTVITGCCNIGYPVLWEVITGCCNIGDPVLWEVITFCCNIGDPLLWEVIPGCCNIGDPELWEGCCFTIGEMSLFPWNVGLTVVVTVSLDLGVDVLCLIPKPGNFITRDLFLSMPENDLSLLSDLPEDFCFSESFFFLAASFSFWNSFSIVSITELHCSTIAASGAGLHTKHLNFSAENKNCIYICQLL